MRKANDKEGVESDGDVVRSNNMNSPAPTDFSALCMQNMTHSNYGWRYSFNRDIDNEGRAPSSRRRRQFHENMVQGTLQLMNSTGSSI